MIKRLLGIIMLLSLLIPLMASADDLDIPTVGILQFGAMPAVEAVELGVLEVLLAHEFINADDHALLAARESVSNDRINVFWGSAGFDLATAAAMVDNALDSADVIVAISAPIAQLAVNATLDMDAPPAIIFTSVYDPDSAGIAQASCVKPNHVTGIGTSVEYEDIVGLLMLQDRGIRTIGVVYNPGENSSVAGAEAISQVGAAFGMTVEVASAATLADVALAAESLIDKGIQAFALPLDTLTFKALPNIVSIANDNDVLVLSPSPEGAFFGAAIGAGPTIYYRRGVQAGHILAGHLKGEIDLADTSILTYSGRGLGINLDGAAEQSVEINSQIVDFSGFVIEDSELFMSAEDIARVDFTEELRVMVKLVIAEGSISVAQHVQDLVNALPPYDYVAETDEFLAGLQCTPEMIAEQQAELEAESG